MYYRIRVLVGFPMGIALVYFNIPQGNIHIYSNKGDIHFYKLLGKGSFGEVFLVSKKTDEGKKLYAMKVLSKEKILGKNLKRYALT